jgi:hypothetical protein
VSGHDAFTQVDAIKSLTVLAANRSVSGHDAFTQVDAIKSLTLRVAEVEGANDAGPVLRAATGPEAAVTPGRAR